MTLGLILAPDVPEKIAKEIASELPELLGSRVDGSVSWDVPVLVDPLSGTNREAPEILDVCRQRRLSEGWDLAICLTDLPVYRGGRLVVADVSAKRAVAGLSLPAMGAMRLRTRGAGAHPPARPRAVREDQGARTGRSSRSRFAADGVGWILP